MTIQIMRNITDFAAVALRDTRYSARVLAKSPGFTLTAVLSLALGIGANTAIFSVLHALLLRSLPVENPRSLFVVARNQSVSAPYPWFVDLRDHSRLLEGVLAFRTAPSRLTIGADTERITAALVSGSYFDVLGVRPSIGTAIENQDDRIPGSGGPRGAVAVLSHSFWLRRFGAQPDAVGTRILLNGHPFTIVGVGPPGFNGVETDTAIDVFAPITMQPVLLPGLGSSLSMPRSQWLRIFGRLRTGVNLSQAETELTALLRRYNEDAFGLGTMPDSARRRSLREQRVFLLPGAAGLSGLRTQYSRPLWLLISVAALVLLIACANVANLLLSRAAARRGEIAIRLSLGADRSRLVRQLFTESLLLAFAGAALGLVLARWMRDLLLRFLPADRTLDAPMDPQVLWFTLLAGVAAALFFGLAPVLQSTRVDVASAIKGGHLPAPGRILFRKGLVVFQMSLSFLLLVAATLFLRSLHNLLTVDPGFARAGILVASVERGPGLDARILKEVKSLPGVISAALADSPPLGTHTGWNIYAPGAASRTLESQDSPSVGFISPGYFATLGIPLLLGRDIDDRDLVSGNNVLVVNDTFARQYFPGENPIGRRVGTKEGVYDWEIVGVVRDSKYTGLREGATRMLFVPARPGPWASRTVIHLRTTGNTAALASALRRKIRDLDKTAALFDVHTVQDALDRALLPERLIGTVSALFGALALSLAAIGLYGLMSYRVARRTREFGIRIAVGAGSRSIVRLVVSEALVLLFAGAVIGLIAASILGRLVKAMLFGIQPADPVSTALAALVLVAAALLAAWIPARRASRVDPIRALRWD